MNNNRIVTSCCRRRNPSDWTYNNIPQDVFIDRGFTGHEHLDQFYLINMNGRVYDPIIAMFLSPDNFVQARDLTQNFNRYTYCLNNPLIYNDPTGMERILPGEYKWRHGIRHLDTDGVGYRYDEYTGTYYYNNNPVSFNEVYYNYIVPNSSWTLVFPETWEVAINDQAALPTTKEDYKLLADNYNSDVERVKANDIRLADKLQQIFNMSLGKLNLKLLTTASGDYGMTSRGIYVSPSNTFVCGYTTQYKDGWAIHISPYSLENDIYFHAFAGHELIHLYHNYHTMYTQKESETIAYKATVDYLRKFDYGAANGEIFVAKKSGWWYETNGTDPLKINSDRAYIWIMGQ